MSCEQGPNRIAHLAGRISGGIAQLAGKRGFYAGLALGGAGLVGIGLAAARRRNGGTPRPQPSPALVDARQVPQLGERARAQPMASPAPGERCAGCRTLAGRKPGAWYTLGGRIYCPDCAPDAAARTGIDLVAPTGPGPVVNLTETGGHTAPVAITVRSQPPLPVERPVPTKLVQSRVGVYTGPDQTGQPIRFAVNGYVVLRPNGYDTGLALTPALRLRQEDGAVEEDTQRWWLTHIPSGKHIPGAGAYERPEQAHRLAGILAQLDWTRDEHELTTEEIRRVGATVSAFNASLAEGKPGQLNTGAPAELTTRRIPADEPLAGKLVADGYGGVARVLDVADHGQRLFVVDSLGQRYEVDRDQVRTPDEADFEGVRVARSFDPTTQPGGQCALCGRATSDPSAGERWYRMNFKTFCQGCATQYAAQEAYIKEEEIGDTLELVG